MIPVPPIAFLIALLALLLVSGGTGYWGYEHGVAIQEARQTKQELANANATIKSQQAELKASDKAGEEHDAHSTQVNVDTSAIGKALRDALAKLPPSADPYMPVWWVRLHDRAASRYVGADPYPGKPDDIASDVRMSESATVLKTDYGIAESCRVQLTDLIARIKDANQKREKIEPETLLQRINPF